MTELPEETLTQNGRDFNYVFKPATITGAPLLVLFHGHGGNARASRLRLPGANILCPIDRFGLKGAGSWFLGAQGDTFWIGAIDALVERYRSAGQKLYFLGSSMGGYAALLHGMRLGADAIYAHIPQTRLLGSNYAKQGMWRYFEDILGPDGASSPFNDLRLHLKGEDGPFVYLTGNRWDKPNYVEEQLFPLSVAMIEAGTPFQLEILPKRGHTLGRSIPDCAEILLAHEPPAPPPIA